MNPLWQHGHQCQLSKCLINGSKWVPPCLTEMSVHFCVTWSLSSCAALQFPHWSAVLPTKAWFSPWDISRDQVSAMCLHNDWQLTPYKDLHQKGVSVVGLFVPWGKKETVCVWDVGYWCQCTANAMSYNWITILPIHVYVNSLSQNNWRYCFKESYVEETCC